MTNGKIIEEKIKFWGKKLKENQKRYQELKNQSPDRWWHDEHFDIQMRVFESAITSTKEQITKLKTELKKIGAKTFKDKNSP